MDDEQQTHDELSRIITALEGIIGRPSRWTGQVIITEDVSFRGRVSWAGDISIGRQMVHTSLRWRTEIHEALHTFSQGLTPSDYTAWRGWEEGVVEKIQRELRPSILHSLNIAIAENEFVQIEDDHRYNRYINALESLRTHLNIDWKDFYLPLLDTPLKERPGYVIQQAQQLQQDDISFMRQFAFSSAILKRTFFT